MRRLSTHLAGILNAAPLALVVVGLLARYLHPGTFWWAAMIAVLLPYAALLLLLSTMVLLALKRRGWVLVNLAVLALVIARLAPAGWLESRPEPGDDDFIVMTFSVPRFGESAEVLADQVFTLLETERPHLVALQETAAWRRLETPGTPRIADYVRPAVDSLGYVLAIPSRLETALTRLPLLSCQERGPVVLDQTERVLTSGEDLNAQSRFVRTRIRWQNREAVLYNVHLRGYGYDKPWERPEFPVFRPRSWMPYVKRYRRAYRLRAADVRLLEEQLEQEELPIILIGDLNVTPDNWDYRVLSRGLTDAFRAAGRGWGATYRGDIPLVRIDYILVDPAFEVVRLDVPDVRFSDHRPVVGRLRWRDRGVASFGTDRPGRDF